MTRYSDIFRRQFRPLEPIPTGETPVLRKLQGVRAVLFDVYGTLFISASGEVGTTRQAACESALAGAFEAVGIDAAGFAGEGVELLFKLIEDSHAESRKAGVDHPEVDIVEIWRQVLSDFAYRGIISGWHALAKRGHVGDSMATQATPCHSRTQATPCHSRTQATPCHSGLLAVEYEARANPCWPMPNVRECLGGLHRWGVLLGIISNAQFYTPELFGAMLGEPPEKWGFQPDLQFYSYRFGRAKPGVEMFESAVAALARRGISPGEVLYVGNDMLNDVFPASQVGFRTALFAGDGRSLRRRDGTALIEGISPDLVVTDLVQILDCIIV